MRILQFDGTFGKRTVLDPVLVPLQLEYISPWSSYRRKSATALSLQGYGAALGGPRREVESNDCLLMVLMLSAGVLVLPNQWLKQMLVSFSMWSLVYCTKNWVDANGTAAGLGPPTITMTVMCFRVTPEKFQFRLFGAHVSMEFCTCCLWMSEMSADILLMSENVFRRQQTSFNVCKCLWLS